MINIKFTEQKIISIVKNLSEDSNCTFNLSDLPYYRSFGNNAFIGEHFNYITNKCPPGDLAEIIRANKFFLKSSNTGNSVIENQDILCIGNITNENKLIKDKPYTLLSLNNDIWGKLTENITNKNYKDILKKNIEYLKVNTEISDISRELGYDVDRFSKYINRITWLSINASKKFYCQISIPIKYEIDGNSVLDCIFWERPDQEKVDNFVYNEIFPAIIGLLYLVSDIRYDLFRQKSIATAQASIMCRNLSHIDGSQILPYVKSRLSSVYEIWKNGLFELQQITSIENPLDYFKRTSDFEYALELTEEHIGKICFCGHSDFNRVQAPFLYGIYRYLNYLQECFDFIANISSDNIPYYSSANFKEFIYDDLNWDYKVRRHKYALQSYNAENLLLENIARSEKIDRTKLQIFFRSFDGNDSDNKDLDALRLINVDLPAGIIGRQAIYSIFKNIIRNSAKHGIPAQKDKTSFVLTDDSFSQLEHVINKELFQFLTSERIKHRSFRSEYEFVNRLKEEAEKSNFNFKLIDQNFDVIKNYAEQPLIFTIEIEDCKNDKNWINQEYWKISITDNNWNGNKAIDILQKALRSEYVYPNGKLQESYKGIKEMRISAAWLRNEKVHEINEQEPGKNEPPILTINRVYQSDDKWIELNDSLMSSNELTYVSFPTNLRYTFFLRKSKKVAMILNNPNDFRFYDTNNTEITININNEWELLTIEDYNNKKNKNYTLLLVDESLDKFEQIKKKSVCRIKQVNITDVKTLFEHKLINIHAHEIEKISKAVESIFVDYYEKWLIEDFNTWKVRKIEKYKFDKRPTIAIVDNQLLGESKIQLTDSINVFLFPTDINTETIIFNRHELNSVEHFDKYHATLNKKKLTLQFLEETSGHNSTFRLTHNEPLDKFWLLKITESSLTKVLIIDERICERYGANDSYFQKTRFHNKGIHIFNITQSNNQFDILDTTDKTLGSILLNEDNDMKIQINNHSDDKFYSNIYDNGVLYYDFVLIHQGLLDKMHEMFSIEIDKIYETLNLHIKSKYHSMVHSGRSKPDKIPKDAIFVLYSSLEKVLEDCKYSLTELLYSARLD